MHGQNFCKGNYCSSESIGGLCMLRLSLALLKEIAVKFKCDVKKLTCLKTVGTLRNPSAPFNERNPSHAKEPEMVKQHVRL